MPTRTGDVVVVVSYSRGFVFAKTQKTAGTSMEVFLARHCGPRDIVTPIYPPNAAHVPRNFSGFFNHMPIRDIVAAVPAARTMFKFCFERHPVEKCLSFYAMQINSPIHQSDSHAQSWVEYVERGQFPNDFAIWSDGERPIVDVIYRYEEMESAIAQIQRKTSIDFATFNEREKSGFRHGVPALSEVTASQKAKIMDAFANSLKWVPYD